MIIGTAAAGALLSSGALTTIGATIFGTQVVSSISENKKKELDLKIQEEQHRDYQERLRLNNQHTENLTRIQTEGQIRTLETQLHNKNEMQRIMNANEEKKISLENERLKEIDAHKKDMESIANQHTEQMEKIKNEANIAEQKNKIEMEKVSGQLKIDMMKVEAQIKKDEMEINNETLKITKNAEKEEELQKILCISIINF